MKALEPARGFWRVFVILFCAFSWAWPAFADLGMSLGFGSRTQSLGGASVAWGFDGYASYDNPAALSLREGEHADKNWALSWGLIVAQPSFLSIDNVVTQNTFTSSSVTMGSVDTNYKATFGQEFGISWHVFPDFLNLSAGATVYFPMNQVAYMDSGEELIPEYFLYREAGQNPQIELGVGADLGRGFHVGAGIHYAFALTSTTNANIQSISGTGSTLRFAASMAPKAAPYLGFLFAPKSNPDLYSFGAVLRFPVTYNNTLNINTSAGLAPPISTIPLNFEATSAMLYDPMELELGTSWKVFSWTRAFAEIDYQAWSNYQLPALNIQNQNPPTGVIIASSPNFSYAFQDIWVPRLGEEFYLSRVATFRLGYAYVPSVLSGLPTGTGNYLDPSQHMINAGFGFRFKHLLWWDAPFQADFNFLFDKLITQSIWKSPGDEGGNASDPKIGSPGYDAGGFVLGGGVTLSLVF